MNQSPYCIHLWYSLNLLQWNKKKDKKHENNPMETTDSIEKGLNLYFDRAQTDKFNKLHACTHVLLVFFLQSWIANCRCCY